ncbi:ATP-grasp domain-containing protein [Bacillus sp. FJAT-49711]|uniref:ATP-grasp domain-containing protein n=1 Tax=Bacillus sp. FJAT-49711 TaxID=2833585 RepID=UPI001BC8DC3C|nr:ATP-grasp domain-containing protein [Bacillus sp. FJAT-49711]MBS4216940.1 ATP-grasp domain-containing protein [Bacillus sp. FJAT-49711]
MKTIIFIGCNQTGTSKEALTIAKEMGFFIVLLTNRKSIDFQDVDHMIFMKDLFNEEMVLCEIGRLEKLGKSLHACLSFIDPYVSYAANLSRKLGLSQLSVDSLAIMENKISFREKLKSLPSSPAYTLINEYDPQEIISKIPFPIILKNPYSNGSKDVFLINSMNKLKERIHILQKKYGPIPILVEEYLYGRQFLIEIMVYNNDLSIVAVIEQELATNDKFIIVGYHYPAELTKEENKTLLESTESIIKQIGLTNGSCHIEMKYTHSEWKLIEINPRMSGGFMNRVIEEGTGINLIKEIIKLNMDNPPSLVHSKKEYVYAKYLTVQANGTLLKVIGTDKALQYIGVKHIQIKANEGEILTTPNSMGSRYACVIAVGSSNKDAKKNALNAAKEIKFYLEPL